MDRRKFTAGMTICCLTFSGLSGSFFCSAEDIGGADAPLIEIWDDLPQDAPEPPQGAENDGNEIPEPPQDVWTEQPGQSWIPGDVTWSGEAYGSENGTGVDMELTQQIEEAQGDLWEDIAAEESLLALGEPIYRRTDVVKRVEDFEILQKEDAEEAFALDVPAELPEEISLDVPEILQKPELPTGCESVSLTMALQYEGFNIDKITLANDFLIYNRETDNMAIGYVGDPFSEEGAGCFSPAIAATAMLFFEDQELEYDVYDVSGSEIDELLAYVAADTPVIVWGTMYMMEPEFTREDSEYDGKIYSWYRQEHCMVLSGYDLENGTLKINDPLEGVVYRDKNAFTRLFNQTGQYAVVLKARTEEAEEAAEQTPVIISSTEVGVY